MTDKSITETVLAFYSIPGWQAMLVALSAVGVFAGVVVLGASS